MARKINLRPQYALWVRLSAYSVMAVLLLAIYFTRQYLSNGFERRYHVGVTHLGTTSSGSNLLVSLLVTNKNRQTLERQGTFMGYMTNTSGVYEQLPVPNELPSEWKGRASHTLTLAFPTNDGVCSFHCWLEPSESIFDDALRLILPRARRGGASIGGQFIVTNQELRVVQVFQNP